MCEQTGSVTMACVAYNQRLVTNRDFEAATFSVGKVTGVTNASECRVAPKGWFMPRRDPNLPRTAAIHGVKFAVLDFSEGGMGNGLHFIGYRTFHEGTCYQLSMRVAVRVGGDGPVSVKVQVQRLKDVREQLNQTLHSFRFLK